MIALACALAAGFLVGRLLELASVRVFSMPLLLRPNYRGRPVPTAVGALVAVATVAVEAVRAVAASFGVGSPEGPALLVAVLGFGLLGLVDDVLGDSSDRGFRGHVRALARGRMTTGMLKLAGGAAVAVVAVALVAVARSGAQAQGRSPGRLLADAALVALAANLGNLFDRAPGRVVKVAGTAFVLLAVATLVTDRFPALVGTAVVLGAALSLLGGDLSERLMLGDAGANVLGAVLGLGVVAACGPGVRTAVLVAVVALNLAGELVSFSRVIEAVPPLRALDRAGRRPPPPDAGS